MNQLRHQLGMNQIPTYNLLEFFFWAFLPSPMFHFFQEHVFHPQLPFPSLVLSKLLVLFLEYQHLPD